MNSSIIQFHASLAIAHQSDTQLWQLAEQLTTVDDQFVLVHFLRQVYLHEPTYSKFIIHVHTELMNKPIYEEASMKLLQPNFIKEII